MKGNCVCNRILVYKNKTVILATSHLTDSGKLMTCIWIYRREVASSKSMSGIIKACTPWCHWGDLMCNHACTGTLTALCTLWRSTFKTQWRVLNLLREAQCMWPVSDTQKAIRAGHWAMRSFCVQCCRCVFHM